MPQVRTEIWAGTEQSYAEMSAVQAQINAAVYSNPDKEDKEDEEDEPRSILRRDGSVGVIPIRGPLMNVDNWFTQAIGLSTYPAIRRALVEAAKAPTISQILLDIDSGGGAVSGVNDTANLISTIDRQVKPVTSTVDGSMASGAYWLGTSGRKVYASATSLVGSVGVITVHMDFTEQAAKEGVKPTVIRSGKFKALGHPLEKLTQTAEDKIQAQLDAVYSVFIAHVADARGMSVERADEKIGQGREFVGEEAVTAGAVDGLASYDVVLGGLKNAVDKQRSFNKNPAHNTKRAVMSHKKTGLTEQEIAAIAEGAQLSQEQATIQAAAEAAAAEQAAAEAAAQAAAEAAAAEAAAEAAAAEVAAQAAAAQPTESELVTFLRAQVAEKDAAITAAAVTNAQLQAQLASVEGTHAGLVAIARASVENMQRPLNGSSGDLSAMSDIALLAEHARVSAIFAKQFRVGGVAAVGPQEGFSKSKPVAGSQAAKLKAVRVNG